MNKATITKMLSSVQISAKDKKELVNVLSKNKTNTYTENDTISIFCNETYSAIDDKRLVIYELTESDCAIIKENINKKNVIINGNLIRFQKITDIFIVGHLIDYLSELNLSGTIYLSQCMFGDIYSQLHTDKEIINHYLYREDTSYKIGQLHPITIELKYNDATTNKSIVSELSLDTSYFAQMQLDNRSSDGHDNIVIGTYYNGTFTAFVDGKITVYDIDSEGNVTQDLSINPELIGTVAKLEVGDADDVCQRNLEIINMAINQVGANHFDVDIDYGVGSATFTQGLADDAIAGTATIIVATGYVTKYNLYGNGKVEKVGNDIDLFALEARIAALESA